MSYFSESAKKSSFQPNLQAPSPVQYNPKPLSKPVCAQIPFGSTSRLDRSKTNERNIQKMGNYAIYVEPYSQYQTIINNLSGIIKSQQKSSSAFVSKTNRFENENKQIPGPGEYNLLSQRKKTYNTQKLLKLKKRTNVSLSTSRLKIPSIPSDHLGYREDSNNNLQKVKINHKFQPHPGSYDIQTDLNKSKGLKWKVEKKLPSKSVHNLPGPGAYDPKLESPLKAPVSSFLSQSKRFLQKSNLKPGPGSYNVLVINKKSHSFNQQGNFSSKISRFGFDKTIQNLGPGQYYNQVKQRVKAKSVSSLKTKINHKENTQLIVQKKTIFDQKNNNPGPGQYANTQGITLKLQRQLFRKFNGTTLPKEKRAIFDISKTPITPGPGSYMKTEQQVENQKQRKLNSHKKIAKRSEPINLKNYENEVSPSPFDYNNFNNTIERKILLSQKRMILTEPKAFGSGQLRFKHYDQQKAQDKNIQNISEENIQQGAATNGDLGNYDVNKVLKKIVMTNLKVKVPFGSSASKFSSKVSSQSPGKFYSHEQTLIKKSHNIRSKIN